METDYTEKKYDVIPNFEEVKFVMNSELTEEQIKAVGLSIKDAVKNGYQRAQIDISGYTATQTEALLNLIEAKRFTEISFGYYGNKPKFMVIELMPILSSKGI